MKLKVVSTPSVIFGSCDMNLRLKIGAIILLFFVDEEQNLNLTSSVMRLCNS